MEETSAGHFIQNRFHHPVTFLPLIAGAQRIRLPPRHTVPSGAVCGLFAQNLPVLRNKLAAFIYQNFIWPACAKFAAECPPQFLVKFCS